MKVLDQGFLELIDHMGDDNRIVQAARTSYGNEQQAPDPRKDRGLIRRLMMDQHTSPFEMVEFCFCVQVPMDCWRQWVRHRTANINEYSTRYAEALDFFQQTEAAGWRLQATDNKQGSSGFLEEWPEGSVLDKSDDPDCDDERVLSDGTILWGTTLDTPGEYLSSLEQLQQEHARQVYQIRLALGVAKEQARKDLPLSTYTRAYWKCDLHNIFNFLRLRMDSHAQLEIRTYANAMYELVKEVCPVACEAFEDYVLHAKRFSRMEMEIIRKIADAYVSNIGGCLPGPTDLEKPDSMTNNEWKNFINKISPVSSQIHS